MVYCKQNYLYIDICEVCKKADCKKIVMFYVSVQCTKPTCKQSKEPPNDTKVYQKRVQR